MPSDKDRLHIALYARSDRPKMPNLEDTYHWALIVGPKKESEGGQGVRYHAKEQISASTQIQWLFEEREIGLHATHMLLVRITIAKIANRDRLADILRNVPIRQGTPGWNCVGWVKEALERLKNDSEALGTNVIDWEKVRHTAMEYCQQKKDGNRFNGQGNFDPTKPPTYDLMVKKETIP
ncbi:hypothetical protein F5I97DRAFT_1976300 [Phlebopus sp. FC_14]|nr:hypothetical protein F5I97DRAFT_1976300 [Phlebopus sp. FC_14]